MVPYSATNFYRPSELVRSSSRYGTPDAAASETSGLRRWILLTIFFPLSSRPAKRKRIASKLFMMVWSVHCSSSRWLPALWGPSEPSFFIAVLGPQIVTFVSADKIPLLHLRLHTVCAPGGSTDLTYRVCPLMSYTRSQRLAPHSRTGMPSLPVSVGIEILKGLLPGGTVDY